MSDYLTKFILAYTTQPAFDPISRKPKVTCRQGKDPNELVVDLEVQPAFNVFYVNARKRRTWKGRTFVMNYRLGPFREIDWSRSLIG